MEVGQPVAAGTINLKVYDQGTYWWDIRGERHTIAEMCTRYRDSVLNFLRRQADAHALRLDFAEEFWDASGPTFPMRQTGWQERTPLFLALLKRPETPREKIVDGLRNAQDRLNWELKKRGLK